LSTKEIDGKKYLEVPDWTSDTTMHDINYAYLEQLPVTELLWFMENCLTLLKKKAVKLEWPVEPTPRQ
jgi:hypothetical protein